MRQFLVLGYHTNQSSEVGEIVTLCKSNSEAIALMNVPEGYRRKAIYEIAIARQQRYFPETIEDFVKPEVDELETVGDEPDPIYDEPETADAVEVPAAKPKPRTRKLKR